MSTGDIVTGIVGSVVDGTNVAITGSTPPIELKRQAVAVNEEGEGRMFDGLFAMFTAMAIMMVGIFGVASTIPYDKKSGVLRRLSITPLKKGQLAAGIIMTYLVVGIIAVTLMTLIAVFGFNLAMNGSWLDYGLFVIIALIMMMSFGWAIGGIAKNTTQSDIYGQIVFLASLAFSGLWFPRALMPEWMQGITAYLPLTPIIEGIQQIITHGAVITSLGFQLAVIAGWTIIAIIIGIKTFRWE